MKKLERLRKEALEACVSRGHKMRRFSLGIDLVWSICKNCGKQVAVQAYPPPNGIEIGGEAVASDCDA